MTSIINSERINFQATMNPSQQFPPTILFGYFFTAELTEHTELIACVQSRTNDSARPRPACALGRLCALCVLCGYKKSLRKLLSSLLDGIDRQELLNPSHYWQKVLFKSFSASFRAASRPTSFETALKPAKKSFKNHIFRIVR